jgi:hypothetical protein
LQSRGEIRRVPTNGRLDQQRYKYALWKPNPLAKGKGDDAFTALARRFFRWVGPATLAELQWFCGLGKKATQEIVVPLELTPAEPGGERLLLPEDVDAWRSFSAPKKPQYALVSSLDPIAANRRDVEGFLDPEDHERGFPTEGAPPEAARWSTCRATRSSTAAASSAFGSSTPTRESSSPRPSCRGTRRSTPRS